MVKKRIYIFLLLLLLIFLVVMFLLFGSKSVKKENYTSVIILGDKTVWKYKKSKFYNITYKSSFQKLSWQKYDVYLNNELIDNYYLWYNDEWYVFDKNRNPIQIDNSFIAVSSNYGLKLENFEKEDINDFTYVNKVLEDNSLSTSSKFTSLYKFSFDIDSDSVNEDFYIMSNAFAVDFTPAETFNIAFAVKNDSIYYIYKDVSNNKGYYGCMPFYNSILDIDNDGKYEFILSCSKYSNLGQIDMLYQFNDEGFKILISNQ